MNKSIDVKWYLHEILYPNDRKAIEWQYDDDDDDDWFTIDGDDF